ncbi:MAG TPA: FecR domain-containing protein [Cyclobacteriaceae bacterium]
MNDIDDLIGKVLAGEASAEEKIQLQNWIRERAENQKYFDQIKTIFERASANQVQLQFDADAAWRRVKGKLSSQKQAKQIWFKTPPFQRTLRIAAGLILILTGGLATYRWYAQPIETFAVVSDAVVVSDTLPDGSAAFLNKKSSLSYEYNPREKKRRVKLTGESFFEVKHEEEKPFIIEAEEVLVQDLGTAFNVKAYPNSDTVEVIVKSGEVQIYTLKNSGLHLGAGETGIYSKRSREFSKRIKADTNALAYKTGVFSFNNTDLGSMIDKINEVYDAHIRLGNEKLAKCHITVNFNNEKLDTVIEVIAETLNLTVTKKDKEILLDGAGCQ